MDDLNSDDEIFETKELDNQVVDIEDIATFNQNYAEMKKNYKSRPFLNKYQKTQIISERSQQLANGGVALIANPESYNSVYEIAQEELRQKKIPFIISIPFSGRNEYWKLEDLKKL